MLSVWLIDDDDDDDEDDGDDDDDDMIWFDLIWCYNSHDSHDDIIYIYSAQ